MYIEDYPELTSYWKVKYHCDVISEYVNLKGLTKGLMVFVWGVWAIFNKNIVEL